MIIWDDFDTRSSRVLCDDCHKDVTEAVKKHIESMSKNETGKRAVVPGLGKPCLQLLKQWTLNLRKRRLTIMWWNVWTERSWWSGQKRT